jgi:hypothetical protein
VVFKSHVFESLLECLTTDAGHPLGVMAVSYWSVIPKVHPD